MSWLKRLGIESPKNGSRKEESANWDSFAVKSKPSSYNPTFRVSEAGARRWRIVRYMVAGSIGMLLKHRTAYDRLWQNTVKIVHNQGIITALDKKKKRSHVPYWQQGDLSMYTVKARRSAACRSTHRRLRLRPTHAPTHAGPPTRPRTRLHPHAPKHPIPHTLPCSALAAAVLAQMVKKRRALSREVGVKRTMGLFWSVLNLIKNDDGNVAVSSWLAPRTRLPPPRLPPPRLACLAP